MLTADVKAKLENAIQRALKSPAVVERLAVLDIEPGIRTRRGAEDGG